MKTQTRGLTVRDVSSMYLSRSPLYWLDLTIPVCHLSRDTEDPDSMCPEVSLLSSSFFSLHHTLCFLVVQPAGPGLQWQTHSPDTISHVLSLTLSLSTRSQWLSPRCQERGSIRTGAVCQWRESGTDSFGLVNLVSRPVRPKSGCQNRYKRIGDRFVWIGKFSKSSQIRVSESLGTNRSWMSWCEVSVALNSGLLDDESTTALLHPGFPNPHWDDRKRIFWK